MFKPRTCGCKGIRTCLICEKEEGVQKIYSDTTDLPVYEYCFKCDKAWPYENKAVVEDHDEGHKGVPVDYPGVLLICDFIKPAEENILVEGCDTIEWSSSVSGRRKQNFGPKTNFKKKKVKVTGFDGFPAFSKFVQDKLQTVALLKDFQTIEQCAIEYRKETGASIDPHIDDCWVWGERIISVSLLSDSVLTMSKFKGPTSKYNLDFRKEYSVDVAPCSDDNDYLVRIPMPRLSLLVLYGAARYDWEHCIYRKDIQDRRICLAYREFTPPYLKGGNLHESVGLNILDKATNFF